MTSITVTGNGYLRTDYAPTGYVVASATGVKALNEDPRFPYSPVVELSRARYPSDGISTPTVQVRYKMINMGGAEGIAAWPIPGYPDFTYMASTAYRHDNDTGAKFAVSMSYTVAQEVIGQTLDRTNVEIFGPGQVVLNNFYFAAERQSFPVPLPGSDPKRLLYSVPPGGYLKIEW